MGKTLHSLKDLKGLIPKDEPSKKVLAPQKLREKPVSPVKVSEDPKVGDRVC